MIGAFLKEFRDINIENIQKVGKKYYQQSPELKEIVDSLIEYPASAGLFLGEIQKNKFTPSPELLNMINLQSNKKIILNEKSAWLFVCGRDIFIEGVIENCFEKGIVLVLNEKQEVLGLGKKDGKTYTNIYDIGVLLRREQTKKRINKK